MSKKSKTAGEKTWEIVRKIRGDWGSINPVSKVIPNKKKNPKIKHKNRQYQKEFDKYDD